MASGTCHSRIKGRTHGRTNQQTAALEETTCQRRAVHTRPDLPRRLKRPSLPFAALGAFPQKPTFVLRRLLRCMEVMAEEKSTHVPFFRLVKKSESWKA